MLGSWGVGSTAPGTRRGASEERAPRSVRRQPPAPDRDLEAHSQHFASLFSHASDAVFVVGRDLRILWWGPRAEALLGICADQALGKHCYEVLAARHLTHNAACGPGCWVMGAARTGSVVPPFCLEVMHSPGPPRAYSVGFLSDASGTFLVHLLRDVTTVRDESPTRMPAIVGDQPDGVSSLTAREREVLRLVMAGATSHQIATALGVSHPTARNHVQNVLGKLNVHKRAQAAVLGSAAGLEPLHDRDR